MSLGPDWYLGGFVRALLPPARGGTLRGRSQPGICALIGFVFDPRAISSAGRAPPRQGGGHWFEPSIAHRIWPRVYGAFCVLGLVGRRSPEAVFPHTSHMGSPDVAVSIGLNGCPAALGWTCGGRSKPSSSSPGRCYAPEQDGWRDLQRIRQPNERRDARITQSTLDPRDLGHMDARAMADLFLREAPPLPRSGDVLRKDIEGRHPRDGLVKLA